MTLASWAKNCLDTYFVAESRALPVVASADYRYLPRVEIAITELALLTVIARRKLGVHKANISEAHSQLGRDFIRHLM